MDIFKGQEIIEFSQRFHSELDCKKYLAELKWKDGYTCRKCGHKVAKLGKTLRAHVIYVVILRVQVLTRWFIRLNLAC